jgi:hypothetical protein
MQQEEEEEEEDSHNTTAAAKELKQQFLRAAYCQRLKNVQWRAVTATQSSPSGREGHGCCLLGDDSNPLLVVTGGFTSDQRIYIKELKKSRNNSNNHDEEWYQVSPMVECLNPDGSLRSMQPAPPRTFFAYGASLTRLNATTAVRFGGFTRGGYAGETSLVAVLTINKNNNNNNNTYDDHHHDVWTNGRFKATWRLVQQGFCWYSFAAATELQRTRNFGLARAYHTATLLNNRYLYIVGGMTMQAGSILDPICLDCTTWTWILYRGVDVGITPTTSTPSGRHGHSVVWDEYRNRLVLFGGGNGSDLLRSGRDNSEVWELKNPAGTGDALMAAAAAPSASTRSSSTIPSQELFLAKLKSCQWRLIHDDQNHYSSSTSNIPNNTTTNVSNAASPSSASSSSSSSFNTANRLRPAETLNLGRCHAAHHVARDTVILLFGSGKPSTNTILAYDLQTDSFVRPKLTYSATDATPPYTFHLPSPRFTFASVFIPHMGCIFAHGGYASQYSQSIVDMALLNLTPAAAAQLHDDYSRQAAFGRAMEFRESHDPVTDQDVLALHTRNQHAPRRFHAVHPYI